MPNDFWQRKKEELQQKGELPMPRPGPVRASEPWWADGTSLLQTRARGPENPLQGQLELPGTVDGHDVSRAMHLKASSECPMCYAGRPGDKKPGLMRPLPSSVARCMSCGYAEGRQLNDPDMLSSAVVSDVATLNVKQTPDGGSRKNSTHLGATGADIAYNNAVLEQSLTGKVTIG